MVKGSSKGTGRGTNPNSLQNLKNKGAGNSVFAVVGKYKDAQEIADYTNKIGKEYGLKGDFKLIFREAEKQNYAGQIIQENRDKALIRHFGKEKFDKMFDYKEGETKEQRRERLDKEFSNVKIGHDKSLIMNTSVLGNLTKEQIQAIIRHEVKHLQQSQSGRLYTRPSFSKSDVIVWKGKDYITDKEFWEIDNDMRLKNKVKRESAYQKYRNFPWEKEAYDVGDPFK